MTVVIAEDHPAEDQSKSKGINGTRPTLHITVQDVRAKYSEVSKVGRTLFPPERNHWGTTWFIAQDPDGNLIAFEEK